MGLPKRGIRSVYKRPNMSQIVQKLVAKVPILVDGELFFFLQFKFIIGRI